jgi:predicted nuclease of predicted toxin-antitoxin system
VGRVGVKLFVDENLSPTLVRVAHDHGYDATCSRDRDLLGLSDHRLLALCVEEERVLVTENAGDFRALCATAGIHPGLILLPSTTGEQQRRLFATLLEHVATSAGAANEEPADFMLDRVIEIDNDGAITMESLP